VLVWGDSIAASGWPQQTEFIFNVLLNTGQPIRMVNKGVGGLAAAVAVGQFETAVLPEKPAVVIIQFGFNDLRYDGSRGDLPLSTPAEFAEHIATMVRRCREELGAAVILFGNHHSCTLLTLPNGLSYEDSLQQYNAAAGQVAVEFGVRYCDMGAVFDAAGLGANEIVTEDGVHLTPRGIRAYAQVAANELRQYLSLNRPPLSAR
jgi:lysophospholipase L1-like esterase